MQTNNTMLIRATSIYDYETIRALVRFDLFKKADPQKRIITWGILLIVISLLSALVFLFIDISFELVVCLIAYLVGYLILCFMYFVFPRIRYNSLKNMKNTKNEFEFSDLAFTITSKNDSYSGEAKVDYALIYKVYETDRYYYIYQDKLQLFVVDKNTITSGTSDVITAILQRYLDKKYIRCKY